MAKAEHFHYPSNDGKTSIHAIIWRPEGQVRAVLQIAHGAQEFIERYDDFASWLNDRGIAVAGNDHLGHGSSIVSEADYGYFAEKNPDRTVILDMRELQRRVQDEYPDVPYFLLGHSMGSFLAREYMCMYGRRLDGVILSGTAWYSAAEAGMGRLLCTLISRFKGWHYRSALVTKVSMGNFNARFEPARTKVDWLTRDEAVVDAYRQDKRTQFTFTLNGYYGLFGMLAYLMKADNLRKMPRNLPVLFIAGEMDPVGAFGEGVKKVFVSYNAMGMTNVQCKLYPNARHEVLNERNRLEVYEDVSKWMDAVITQMERSAG